MCRLMVNSQLLRSVFQHHGQRRTLTLAHTNATQTLSSGWSAAPLSSESHTGTKMSDSRRHSKPKVTWFPLNAPRHFKKHTFWQPFYLRVMFSDS